MTDEQKSNEQYLRFCLESLGYTGIAIDDNNGLTAIKDGKKYTHIRISMVDVSMKEEGNTFKSIHSLVHPSIHILCNILIVEDDPCIIEMFKDGLADVDNINVTYCDSKETVEKTRHIGYDLMFFDGAVPARDNGIFPTTAIGREIIEHFSSYDGKKYCISNYSSFKQDVVKAGIVDAICEKGNVVKIINEFVNK